MQGVASLELGEARQLLEYLQKHGIPAELQPTKEESGLDIMEVLVPDDDYDRACVAAGEWDEQRVDDIQRKSPHRCPKCGSHRLEVLPNEKEVIAYRCRDCGAEILF
jgi:DNA-directed RNA polymerase subunit RPC12/RpoP